MQIPVEPRKYLQITEHPVASNENPCAVSLPRCLNWCCRSPRQNIPLEILWEIIPKVHYSLVVGVIINSGITNDNPPRYCSRRRSRKRSRKRSTKARASPLRAASRLLPARPPPPRAPAPSSGGRPALGRGWLLLLAALGCRRRSLPTLATSARRRALAPLLLPAARTRLRAPPLLLFVCSPPRTCPTATVHRTDLMMSASCRCRRCTRMWRRSCV